MGKDWKKADIDEVEDEFYRELDTMCKSDLLDVVIGLIPEETKREFVQEWHDSAEE